MPVAVPEVIELEIERTGGIESWLGLYAHVPAQSEPERHQQ